MSKLIRSTGVLALSIVLCASMAAVAAKAKPSKKAAAKTTNHATTGTTQMKGEYADIGSTYTLGKESPWNVTLKSAEYTLNPVVIGENIYYPKAEEKLLVLHFSLHNPQKQEAFARFDTLNITAVDAKNENHEFINDAGVESTKSDFSMTMKPAQKVDFYTAVIVPAAGEVPKLIVKSEDNLVLRYDLKGKLKGLPAPFADPKDTTGATALAKVSAKTGTFYPLGEFSFKLDGITFSEKSIKDLDLDEGNQYIILNASVRNDAPTKQFFRFDTLLPVLTDADDAEATWTQRMLAANRDADFSMDMDPAKEVNVRFVFQAPKDMALKTFAISEEEGRVYQFDVSSR